MRFEFSTRICCGENALSALQTLDAKKVLLVTDRFFAENGTAQHICSLCGGAQCEIFDQVQPDPPLALIAEGVRRLDTFVPDTLLALGGGSAIDCAKGMLAMAQTKPRFVAIPTSSGTGSEVTSFAILTHDGVKHPLVDEALRPSLAILDAALLDKLPPALIADAGMDVLAHCLEAVVAKNATPFSDALAGCAFRTVLERLPASYRGERGVREEIHCAATMAGIAFDNAGLGACHALSHAIGGAFHLPHGRVNGILLPHVLQFNGSQDGYRRLAALCGLSGQNALGFAVKRVRRQLDLPGTLTEAGLSREAVLAKADAVANAAANDPCSATNPVPAAHADYLTLLTQAL